MFIAEGNQSYSPHGLGPQKRNGKMIFKKKHVLSPDKGLQVSDFFERDEFDYWPRPE